MPPVDVLLLTKKRLQNLRRKRLGLEQLAVRVILKHLIFYLRHPKKLEKLTSLPGVLRDKILQVLMQKKCLKKQGEQMEFEIMIKFFSLLLSPRTRYIELNGILSFCPDRYKNGKIEKVTQWDGAKEMEAMPILFPKVTCLMVKSMDYTYSAVDVMPKFDNITQLHLLNLMGNIVNIEKYLIAYGQKLQSLYLGNGNSNTTIDLELVFKYCPKLEKLSLLNACLQKPSSQMNFFAELKELEWVFYLNSYNSTPYRMFNWEIPEIMVLSDILLAPKLEKVTLEAKIFNQADLWILNFLIEKNGILNNLHTLHVYFTLPIHRGELKSLADVMKSACAFLPKLTDFKFGERNQFEDPLLACLSTPRDISYIDECVYSSPI
ncbi:Hypothetical predicted protein [Cloeon dipterum]|uniref:FBD domain-containing protein n=1 Tax=Cloeon dipterum TaxID=197152 RepID=A0A8S1CNX3_9INSE|nr:Hypothetical predicted protein [Cloeon dipterum]